MRRGVEGEGELQEEGEMRTTKSVIIHRERC